MKKIILVLLTSILLSACNNKSTVTTSTSTLSPTLSITEQKSVPLPSEEDIIRSFFNLIDESKPSDAVMTMTSSITENDSQKQAWAVQFNAISLIKVLTIEASMPEEWTDLEHSYKVNLEVKMNPDSASASIPYYGWDNGENIRWVTIVKEDNLWKIKNIATGP
jgi:hypothetical protein